jgi:hypothetical protein
MSAWEDAVKADVLKKIPETTAERILKPAFQEFGRFGFIKMATPAYPIWLKSTDPHRRVELTQSVQDFQRQRTNYFEVVRDLLRTILFYDTGFTLITELGATNKTVFIRPYKVYRGNALNADARPIGEDGTVGGLQPTVTVTATGMNIYDNEGEIIEGSGLGKGLDAAVEFSPEMFGPGSEMTGPGSERDEVLFHEMVHASRMMRGRMFALPVSQGYTNEEEYISVVLTNVYMSEKGQRTFRANHEFPSKTLLHPEKFLDNVQGVDMAPLVLIERFRLNTPDFYRAFAAIEATSAPFNPIRDFERRRAAGKIKFH